MIHSTECSLNLIKAWSSFGFACINIWCLKLALNLQINNKLTLFNIMPLSIESISQHDDVDSTVYEYFDIYLQNFETDFWEKKEKIFKPSPK